MTQSELKELTNLGAELGAAKAEIEVLREQVKVLQSDANSWQSGYDKGRNDGCKHRKSEVEQLRQHKNEYMDAAEVTRKALLAEIESLRNGLKNARYRIEQGRVWNGMGWTLTGLHAHQQQKALDEIEAALSHQADPVPAQDEWEAATDAAYAAVVDGGWSSVKEMGVKMFQAGAEWVRAARPAQTEQQPIYQIRPRENVRDWLDTNADGYRAAKAMASMEVRMLYAAPIAQTEQQPSVVADVSHWDKSLATAWPADEQDAQGAWIIGAIDEDDNKYEVITVEADQYDAPGDSEKIARALIALWSQAFAAPIAQIEQQPIRLPQRKNLDGLLDPESKRAGRAYNEALEDVELLNAAPIAQTAPQPEQSEEIAWDTLKAATDILERRAAPHAWISLAWEAGSKVITSRRAALSTQGAGDASA